MSLQDLHFTLLRVVDPQQFDKHLSLTRCLNTHTVITTHVYISPKTGDLRERWHSSLLPRVDGLPATNLFFQNETYIAYCVMILFKYIISMSIILSVQCILC